MRQLSSHHRLLSLLEYFSLEKPSWTADEIIDQSGMARSTVYRYLKTLCEFSLLENIGNDQYILGARFTVMDHVIRSCDPFLQIAEPEVRWLSERTGFTVSLTRLIQEQMVGVLIVRGRNSLEVGYDRGELLSLFKGCTGKVILAHLPRRILLKLYDSQKEKLKALGLGGDWNEFLKTIRSVSKLKSFSTQGEIQSGNLGIAAPIFGKGKQIMGSMTLIMREEDSVDLDLKWVHQNVEVVAERISDHLRILDLQKNEKQAPQKLLKGSSVFNES